MIRNLITAGALVLATASIAHAGGVEATGEVPEWMTRTCPVEDSVNCHWNAQVDGNGNGHSFYARLMPGPKGHRITCVFYVDRPRWDYCS